MKQQDKPFAVVCSWCKANWRENGGDFNYPFISLRFRNARSWPRGSALQRWELVEMTEAEYINYILSSDIPLSFVEEEIEIDFARNQCICRRIHNGDDEYPPLGGAA